MKPGIRVGVGVLGNAPDEMVALARHAEQVGFHRVWFGDHLAQPERQASEYPYAQVPLTLTTVDYIDPLVQAAAIAAATTSVLIATGIYLLPMHHPLVVARALSTLQSVAGGRFELGVGAGWMPEEFTALGVPFERRGRRMDESLEILRLAQAGGVIEYHGREFSFEPLTITHRAVSVPLIVGGTSDAAIRRAARLGDGWYSTPDLDVEGMVRMRDRIEALRAKAGTATRPFTHYVRLSRPDPALAEAYVAEGFTELTVGGVDIFPRATVSSMTLDEKRGILERVAGEFGLS